jgi:hypothetical protein
MCSEARYNFQTFKHSRIAYSKAKTSVIYLPETVATASFEDAVLLVQKAHEKLHLAETFKKDLPKHLKWYPYPEIWSEQMYWQITAVKRMLQSHVDTWKPMPEGERLRCVLKVVDAVESFYREEARKLGPANVDVDKDARESTVRQAIEAAFLRLGKEDDST